MVAEDESEKKVCRSSSRKKKKKEKKKKKKKKKKKEEEGFFFYYFFFQQPFFFNPIIFTSLPRYSLYFIPMLSHGGGLAHNAIPCTLLLPGGGLARAKVFSRMLFAC